MVSTHELGQWKIIVGDTASERELRLFFHKELDRTISLYSDLAKT